MPPTRTLYLEDLAAGQVYTAGPIQVSAERIKSFAEEFDPQEQHTDPGAARDQIFGEVVASGWHTSAIAMRLMYEAVLHRFPNGTKGLGVDQLRWLAPVRPADALHASMVVDQVRPSASKPTLGVLTMTVQVFNQAAVKVLQMTVSALVPRKG